MSSLALEPVLVGGRGYFQEVLQQMLPSRWRRIVVGALKLAFYTAETGLAPIPLNRPLAAGTRETFIR